MVSIDPAKAKVRLGCTHPATLFGLVSDPAAGKLYAGSEDTAIHVFDLASGKKEPVARWAKHENYVSALALMSRPGQTIIVSGSYDRRLVWWDAARGEVVRSVEAHAGWVRDVISFPDRSCIASCGDDMLVKIWDVASGKLVRTLAGHALRTPQGHVTALYVIAITPDGRHLASADRHGTVIVCDLATGQLHRQFEVPKLYTYDPRERKRSIGGIRSLAFSRDGVHLAVGGIGQVGNVDGLAGPAHVEVWDWKAPRMRFAAGLQGHKGIINDLFWHPSEPWLIGAGGGGDGGFLGFWKVDKIVDAPPGKTDAVVGVKVKSDGHVHRLAQTATANEIVAAGYKKLDVWTLT